MTPVPITTSNDWTPTLIKSGVVLTTLHLVATAVSLISGDNTRAAMVVVFASLFLLGVAGCIAAFVVAVNRSRHEQIDIAGAFFLAGGVVDPATKRTMFALLGAQTLIGVGGASLAPLTGVAFSVLVPVLGIAGIALVGSLSGTFARKPEPDL